jgi:hypothetical protein
VLAKTEVVKVEKPLELKVKCKKTESIKACPDEDIMTEKTIE